MTLKWIIKRTKEGKTIRPRTINEIIESLKP